MADVAVFVDVTAPYAVQDDAAAADEGFGQPGQVSPGMEVGLILEVERRGDLEGQGDLARQETGSPIR